MWNRLETKKKSVFFLRIHNRFLEKKCVNWLQHLFIVEYHFIYMMLQTMTRMLKYCKQNIYFQGLAQHNKLCHCLQSQHPIWMPFSCCTPGSGLCYCSRESRGRGPDYLCPCSHVDNHEEAPGCMALSRPSPGCCSPLENEPMDVAFLSVQLPSLATLAPYNSAYKIK